MHHWRSLSQINAGSVASSLITCSVISWRSAKGSSSTRLGWAHKRVVKAEIGFFAGGLEGCEGCTSGRRLGVAFVRVPVGVTNSPARLGKRIVLQRG